MVKSLFYMTLTHTICNSMHTEVQGGSYPVDGAPPPKVCQMSCWCNYHNQFTMPSTTKHCVNTHLSRAWRVQHKFVSLSLHLLWKSVFLKWSTQKLSRHGLLPSHIQSGVTTDLRGRPSTCAVHPSLRLEHTTIKENLMDSNQELWLYMAIFLWENVLRKPVGT